MWAGGRAGMKSAVMDELKTAIGNYSKAATSTERYKQWHLQMAISAVKELDGPLSESWVDANIKGPETQKKVKEIMRLGYLKRNKAMRESTFHQVRQSSPLGFRNTSIKHERHLDANQGRRRSLQPVLLFRRVWGCGANLADLFYSQGYKTLDDLRQASLDGKINNSRMDIGLKYFDDFEQRIPREEVRTWLPHPVLETTQLSANRISSRPHSAELLRTGAGTETPCQAGGGSTQGRASHSKLGRLCCELLQREADELVAGA